jgi:integrase/recombinase XerD
MPSLYTREKDPAKGTWHFRRVKEGRGVKTGDLRGTFYARPFINGRQRWQRLNAETFTDAKREAADLPDKLKARALGVTVEEAKSNRVLIKTAVDTYLQQNATKARKTVLQYKNTLEQFIEALKGKARFLDEIDEGVLRHYKRFLENLGYAGKTIDTRLNIVFFLLKKNGVRARIPRDEMPAVEEEAAVPYSDDELKNLFAEMAAKGGVEKVKGKEYTGAGFGQEIRYRFFLGTACRDKEVTYAAWADIDFNNRKYHVRRKEDVGFAPKSHESRTIPLPGALVELLRKRREEAPDKRWIFVTEKGNPENHFLRKLKAVAKRAGLNCGNCKTAITEGRYDKRQVEVTCETHPVCEHFILRRFRKTCATRWMNNNVPVRTIQHWLGHKSLETTMIYLGVQDSQQLQTQVDEAYGD